MPKTVCHCVVVYDEISHCIVHELSVYYRFTEGEVDYRAKIKRNDVCWLRGEIEKRDIREVS